MIQRFLILIIVLLSFNGCSTKVVEVPTIANVKYKLPKLPTYKYPIRPKIRVYEKNNHICMPKEDWIKIKLYCKTLYNRFDKLNKINRRLNAKN